MRIKKQGPFDIERTAHGACQSVDYHKWIQRSVEITYNTER
jgi:hypothetical protein